MNHHRPVCLLRFLPAAPFIVALLIGIAVITGCSAGIKGHRDYDATPDGWSMFRNSPTGYTSTPPSLKRPVRLIWDTKLKGRLYASPVINDGLGILPSLDKRVFLFDPLTGDGKGKIRTKSSTSSSPALVGNLLYFASEKGDGRLRCINVNSGKTVWEQKLGDMSAPMAVQGKSLLIGNYAGEFYCIDRLTGGVDWSYQTGGPIVGGAAAADGRVFVGSTDGSVYCLNQDDGELVWRFEASEAIFSSPAIGRYCYIGSTDRRLYAVDPADGKEMWSFETGGQIFSSPVLDDQAVYIGSNDGCLYAVEHDSGKPIWRIQTGAIVNSTPLVLSDAVVFGSGDSYVYFVDKRTGRDFFKYETESQIISSPIYFRDRIYVACAQRRFYCFGTVASDPAINAEQ